MVFLRKIIGVDRTINLIKKRTDAEVIFSLLHRYSLNKYVLILEELQDIWSRFEREPSSIGEAVLKVFEHYIYSYPEAWYQWKNYAEIKAISATSKEEMESTPFSLLKPAFHEFA
jgi:hypothetical protein